MLRPALTHVGIFAIDRESLARYYSEVVGMRETDRGITATGRQAIFLSADAAHHHQLVIVEGREAGQSSTISQLSFLLPDLHGLRDIRKRIMVRGGQTRRIVDHGTAWSIYASDPEDNTMEFYVTTPWYISQPYAAPLNLDLSDRKILSTTESRCRAESTFMNMKQWQAQMQAALDDGSNEDDRPL